MSCVAPVVSHTAAGWVTTWLVPTNSTVGAEVALPTNTIAGLGSVPDSAAELGAMLLAATPVRGSEERRAGFEAVLRVETERTGAPAVRETEIHHVTSTLVQWLVK